MKVKEFNKITKVDKINIGKERLRTILKLEKGNVAGIEALDGNSDYEHTLKVNLNFLKKVTSTWGVVLSIEPSILDEDILRKLEIFVESIKNQKTKIFENLLFNKSFLQNKLKINYPLDENNKLAKQFSYLEYVQFEIDQKAKHYFDNSKKSDSPHIKIPKKMEIHNIEINNNDYRSLKKSNCKASTTSQDEINCNSKYDIHLDYSTRNEKKKFELLDEINFQSDYMNSYESKNLNNKISKDNSSQNYYLKSNEFSFMNNNNIHSKKKKNNVININTYKNSNKFQSNESLPSIGLKNNLNSTKSLLNFNDISANKQNSISKHPIKSFFNFTDSQNKEDHSNKNKPLLNFSIKMKKDSENEKVILENEENINNSEINQSTNLIYDYSMYKERRKSLLKFPFNLENAQKENLLKHEFEKNKESFELANDCQKLDLNQSIKNLKVTKHTETSDLNKYELLKRIKNKNLIIKSKINKINKWTTEISSNKISYEVNLDSDDSTNSKLQLKINNQYMNLLNENKIPFDRNKRTQILSYCQKNSNQDIKDISNKYLITNYLSKPYKSNSKDSNKSFKNSKNKDLNIKLDLNCQTSRLGSNSENKLRVSLKKKIGSINIKSVSRNIKDDWSSNSTNAYNVFNSGTFNLPLFSTYDLK